LFASTKAAQFLLLQSKINDCQVFGASFPKMLASQGETQMQYADHQNHNKHYVHLGMMTVLSFISMYIFMYAMVDSFANVYSNWNQIYMAGLMTAPMILIEIVVMRSMYMNRKINALILAGSVVALIGFFALIRNQTAITDKQFLRSMIPHHAGAVLMCEQSPVQEPALKELCKNIISSQQAEIEQMKTLLQSMEAK
jgi:uncharacterized protein (DUF305 family)